jgi:hypothetical protein
MRKLVAPAIGAITLVVLMTAPSAEAKSKWADIRVVANDGFQMADHRQYTDSVRVKASEDAACFGESNPSSNERYQLDEPTALGTLIDATRGNGTLQPLLITDAFFSQFGSFGVCGIGAYVGSDVFGEEYWYNANNGVGASAGPNQIPVENGDQHLWYFATGAESAISELELKAPVRVTPGEPFEVKVTRVKPDGSKEPAEGATVVGDVAPTDKNGVTDVIVSEGYTSLVAEGDSDDVVSRAMSVCASDNLDQDCPEKHRGLTIYGSRSGDEIKASRGIDSINCGKGKDVVLKAQGKDTIASNCEKVKQA